MLLLDSKNIESVSVYVRGEEHPIAMPAARGAALMAFLTNNDPKPTHVQINDSAGATCVVRITDITKVVPSYKAPSIQDELERIENETN